jgi:hypothetical protein
MMFTLCLLNVAIEKNTCVVIKLRLFNVSIFRNYFALMQLCLFNIKYKCDYEKACLSLYFV